MFGDHITMAQALVVCVFSLIVVFVVLYVLIGLTNLTSKLVNRSSKSKRNDKDLNAEAETGEPAGSEVSNDTTAVLAAAAIAAYLGTSADRIIVKSIRPVEVPESSWSRTSRVKALH